MALDATNVLVGVTGSIHVAPLGTTLPTDHSSALDAAFEEVGYVGEEGITESQDNQVTSIVAWQNAQVVRKFQTEHDLTYAFAMLEAGSDAALETFYGNRAAGVVEINADQLPNLAWVITIVDGTNIVRLVIPDGSITERGSVEYVSEDAAKFPVTLSCFPDTNEVKAYRYDGTAA